jgi:hypothetical protein
MYVDIPPSHEAALLSLLLPSSADCAVLLSQRVVNVKLRRDGCRGVTDPTRDDRVPGSLRCASLCVLVNEVLCSFFRAAPSRVIMCGWL